MRCANQKSGIGNRKSTAFTLVELLVVITIIGILIALLLPAVQAAREAARQVQCQNNLKQVALACLNHEQANGFLPTGGWGYCFVGDANRGFDKRQPGGWLYNVLPYMEQPRCTIWPTHNQTALANRVGTPLAAFYCPTRRSVAAYPNARIGTATKQVNINPQPPLWGRSDYAGNGGDYVSFQFNIGSCDPRAYPLTGGDALSDATWAGIYGGATGCTGIFYVRSTTRVRDIKDGTANTYLAGENLRPGPLCGRTVGLRRPGLGFRLGLGHDPLGEQRSALRPRSLPAFPALAGHLRRQVARSVVRQRARRRLRHGLLRRLRSMDELLGRSRGSPLPGQHCRRPADRRQDVLAAHGCRPVDRWRSWR